MNSRTCMQEAFVIPPYVVLGVRLNPGQWAYLKVNSDDVTVHSLTPSQYLKLKESIYDQEWYAQRSTFTWLINLDHVLF